MYLLLYVDNILLTASSTSFLQQITTTLGVEFSITDMGDLNYFLGVSVITRDTTGMFLSQRKYALEILTRANVLNCKSARTLTDTLAKLDDSGPTVTNPALYRSLVSALQYLTFTQPDLTYVVQQIFYTCMTRASLILQL